MKPQREQAPREHPDVHVLIRLVQAGYQGDYLPLRLVPECPRRIAGALADFATETAPIDLGLAEVVLVEETAFGLVLLHVAGGNYYATAFKDLFFVGQKFPVVGRLYFAHDFCVLCGEETTVGQAISKIRLVRQTLKG